MNSTDCIFSVFLWFQLPTCVTMNDTEVIFQTFIAYHTTFLPLCFVTINECNKKCSNINY